MKFHEILKYLIISNNNFIQIWSIATIRFYSFQIFLQNFRLEFQNFQTYNMKVMSKNTIKSQYQNYLLATFPFNQHTSLLTNNPNKPCLHNMLASCLILAQATLSKPS
jgi:hypothetical protein